ncbi:hypothetical protein XELAEV_18003948mg [Xenopus laevis]|uniref:Uncharacterized protein n=1 Tax=Xenopus laevis TaxID=8355 RepID=A0A974BPF6_XENLA|nr:hypothetical protein XELAEV_18003948mg [Xenopus laevis]
MGLQINQTKVVTAGRTAGFRVDGEEKEVIRRFCLLQSIINNNGCSIQSPGRTRTNCLETVFNYPTIEQKCPG